MRSEREKREKRKETFRKISRIATVFCAVLMSLSVQTRSFATDSSDEIAVANTWVLSTMEQTYRTTNPLTFNPEYSVTDLRLELVYTTPQDASRPQLTVQTADGLEYSDITVKKHIRGTLPSDLRLTMDVYYISRPSGLPSLNFTIAMPGTLIAKELFLLMTECPDGYDRITQEYNTKILYCVGYGLSRDSSHTASDVMDALAPETPVEPEEMQGRIATVNRIPFYMTLITIGVVAVISVIALLAIKKKRNKKQDETRRAERSTRIVSERNRKYKELAKKQTITDMKSIIKEGDYSDTEAPSPKIWTHRVEAVEIDEDKTFGTEDSFVYGGNIADGFLSGARSGGGMSHDEIPDALSIPVYKRSGDEPDSKAVQNRSSWQDTPPRSTADAPKKPAWMVAEPTARPAMTGGDKEDEIPLF